MKFCSNCGAQLADDAKFCTGCGTPVVEAPVVEAPVVEAPVVEAPVVEAPDRIIKEKECLDGLYGTLKGERIAWKIFGIIWLVLTCLFGLICIIALIGAVTGGTNISFYVTVNSDYYPVSAAMACIALVLFLLVLFLPMTIINLKMKNRAGRCMKDLYVDARPAIGRCGSVGMIVVAALFNEIALIFVIINFVRCKSNKELLQRVVERQQSFNAENSVRQ